MSVPAIPINFVVTQANRQVLAQWGFTVGATSYTLQRSTDQINYSTIATVVGSTLYVDTAVITGTAYWYQVCSNNVSGASSFTSPQQIVPAPTGEFSLAGIRLAAMQRADRVNSNFVTTQEWTSYINQAMFELYDLLVTTYSDYYVATPAQFITTNNQSSYPLPDGITVFQNGTTNAPGYVAPAFYKLLGVDLGLSTANNAWVTVKKFNWSDRNRYVYPNTASTIYGVFNLQYRVMGNLLDFIPPPSNNQPVRIWYIPRLTELLLDTDITTTGISGWIEYVIVRAAKYALDKEESDTSKLTEQIVYLKGRIEESAQNRDAAFPDTISDVRGTSWNGQSGNGWGPQGSSGGWAFIFPVMFSNYIGNGLLNYSEFFSKTGLTYAAFCILFAYFSYLALSKLCGRVRFSRTCNLISSGTSTFLSHVMLVIFGRAKKDVIGVYARRIVTFMTSPKSFWNRPVESLPDKSVGSLISPNTITLWRSLPIPFPASGQRWLEIHSLPLHSTNITEVVGDVK